MDTIKQQGVVTNVGRICGPTPLLEFIDAIKYPYTIKQHVTKLDTNLVWGCPQNFKSNTCCQVFLGCPIRNQRVGNYHRFWSHVLSNGYTRYVAQYHTQWVRIEVANYLLKIEEITRMFLLQIRQVFG